MEENKAYKPEYIEHQENNNCQQFFGTVTGCVFAMPGSQVGMPTIAPPLEYPKEGDYNGVREYVEARKERDSIFVNYCHSHSRKELCERISDDFGWVVDDKSYGRNIQRYTKKH